MYKKRKGPDGREIYPYTMTVKCVSHFTKGAFVFKHPMVSKIDVQEWGYQPQTNITLEHWNVTTAYHNTVEPLTKEDANAKIVLGAPVLDWDNVRNVIVEAESTITGFQSKTGNWDTRMAELELGTRVCVQAIKVRQNSRPPYNPFLILIQGKRKGSVETRVLKSNTFTNTQIDNLLVQRMLYWDADSKHLTSKTGCWIFEFEIGMPKDFVINGKEIRGATLIGFRINPEVYSGTIAQPETEPTHQGPRKLLPPEEGKKPSLWSIDRNVEPGQCLEVRSVVRAKPHQKVCYFMSCVREEGGYMFDCRSSPHLTELLHKEYDRLLSVGNTFKISVGRKSRVPGSDDEHLYYLYTLM
ncbi:hypothetical protein BDK51DRAFT_43446 [Blyttiomyces helicus]|uniref:Uncharacterized protein n=1 Tax=Blyttiomyces helicus TaxID=388810 RepID=A0A4P9WU40_9FUNG|nr:hypothetical protein BDK51DRAFT_43446 [Blyttiomyces helicus]|eukprot:RKO94636.1 hypothetical protein BDK51DRAFT_43446 [Blyttiomyces helicus]